MFCLTIFEDQSDDVVDFLAPGNVVEFKNCRCDDSVGELELKWSNLVSEEQLAQGFKAKKPRLLEKTDDRVRVINT